MAVRCLVISGNKNPARCPAPGMLTYCSIVRLLYEIRV